MTNDTGTNKSTNTAVALRPEAVQAMTDATGFTTPQVYVVKKNLFKNEGDEADLWLFLTTCKRLGADPFAKQIHAVFRWNNKTGRKEMAIQIGIDQLRLTAARTGEFGGRLGPLWKARGADKPWADLWEEDGDPFACKVGGWKIGAPENPTWAVVKWDEFAQTDKEGRLMGQWRTMGAHMLAKCAEAQMLRILFPMETRDLRIREETPEADERAQVFAEQDAARAQAICQPSRTRSKRYETTPGFPTAAVIEGNAVIEPESPADPVTDDELDALGTAMPGPIRDLLASIQSRYFAGDEVPWNDDPKRRAGPLKSASDQLRLHEYKPEQRLALYAILHFGATGEALEGDVEATCSGRCFVVVQALGTPELEQLREGADWWIAQTRKAA